MVDIVDLYPEYFDCVWRPCPGVVLTVNPPIEPFSCVRCGQKTGASNYGDGYKFQQRVCPSFILEDT